MDYRLKTVFDLHHKQRPNYKFPIASKLLVAFASSYVIFFFLQMSTFGQILLNFLNLLWTFALQVIEPLKFTCTLVSPLVST